MRVWTRRLLGPAMGALAFAVFWVLSHGTGAVSVGAVAGYAEATAHSVAPVLLGRLDAVDVRVGEPVKAGQRVAQLDRRTFVALLELAEAERDAARAELLAQTSVQGAQMSKAALQALKLRMTQSRDRAELAEVEEQLVRLEKLSSQGLVRAEMLEESRGRRAALAASVKTYEGVAAKEGELRGVKEEAALSELEQRLAPYREAVRAREAEVKAAQLALDATELRAPVDGVVSAISQWPGNVVPAGIEVVRIITARPNHVQVFLTERQALAVKPGQSAVLRASAFSQPFGGKVVEISPAVEPLPPRAWMNSNTPRYGRLVTLETWPPRPLLMGEVLNVRM